MSKLKVVLAGACGTAGNYTGEDGQPHEYSGHWSWVPTYNNHIAMIEGGHGQLYGPLATDVEEIEGYKVTPILHWLAQQERNSI